MFRMICTYHQRFRITTRIWKREKKHEISAQCSEDGGERRWSRVGRWGEERRCKMGWGEKMSICNRERRRRQDQKMRWREIRRCQDGTDDGWVGKDCVKRIRDGVLEIRE